MTVIRPSTVCRRGVFTVVALLATGCYQGVDPRAGSGIDTATGGIDTADDSGDSGDDTGIPDDDDTLEPPLQGMHRLNRLEYDNTVRDLLGTNLRPGESLGPDPEANGFDNQAEQLQITSALVDAYDSAARRVIDDVLNASPIFSALFEGDSLAVAGGYPVGSLWALSGNTLGVQVTVPEGMDGEVVLSMGASVVGSAPDPQAFLRVDGADRGTFTVQGSAANRELHIEGLFLEAGEHSIQLVPTNHINEAASNISNNIFVESIQVRSLEVGDAPGRALVYVCEPAAPGDVSCYELIVRTFATRAWRRPVRDDEAMGLMGLWEDTLDAGESPDQALRLVLRAVMMSPKFFTRLRTDQDEDGDGWLDDYVLASRLSYFLWSSMPDDRLFAMAKEGRLASDEGLTEAVAFMLDDPKAEALLDGFAEQWLSTRHLAGYAPSPDTYPSFDEDVRAAMVAESKAFFGDFLTNEAPLGALLQPDFAYRNDRLASHYGLQPVGSAEVTRVEAQPGERRGLLTLGAWLTATSGPDHSSPIRRGHWITDRVMCMSPPPPPPGLEFEPPELGGDEPVRDALERHRNDPGCASCHALLDVVGMGVEEYDGVAAPILDPNVDNLGELPDGTTFAGADELAQLYADSPQFVGCVTEKMFTYALGRPVDDDYDETDLEVLVERAADERYDLRRLIDGIVHTPSFRSPAPL